VVIQEEKLIKQWKKDEKALFQGWNFSYIQKRYKEEKPNWNYKLTAKKFIKKSKSVLDMGTGGGEIFADILSAFTPSKIFAIEGYQPNISVARRRLRPFGVTVIHVDETKKLPFHNGTFDLVLNRHSGFNIEELARVTSSGGIFLTQQVDGCHQKDLMKEFGVVPKWEFNTLSKVKKHLKDIGFDIKEAKEWTGKSIFKDVGALVYLLKTTPWLVDNFGVKNYLPVLKKLQKRVEKNGKLVFTAKKFFILAKNNSEYSSLI